MNIKNVSKFKGLVILHIVHLYLIVFVGIIEKLGIYDKFNSKRWGLSQFEVNNEKKNQ